MLINHQQDLDDLCRKLREAAPIGFDTEFVSERLYFARLCLVQVCAGTGDDRVEGLIDPFDLDLRPFLDLMSDNSVAKVVHAGAQDLQILFQSYGCEARHVFDTQIAGAFLGYGHQVGYVDLVARVLGGPRLSKGSQYSDWAARPLSADQVEYALADARYLAPMYARLRKELVSKGRLEWAQSEFRRAELRARETLSSEEAYVRLRTSGLTRVQLGVLRELAAARDRIAREINRPPSFLVPDAALVQMARQPPHSVAELRGMRGMPSVSPAHGQALLAAVEQAAALRPDELPQRYAGNGVDPQADAVAGLLGVVAQLRAIEHGISRTYLAPRDQMIALASWWLRKDEACEDVLPDLDLLSDWRGELVGREMLDLLEGRIAMVLDRAGAVKRSSALRVIPMAQLSDPKKAG